MTRAHRCARRKQGDCERPLGAPGAPAVGRRIVTRVGSHWRRQRLSATSNAFGRIAARQQLVVLQRRKPRPRLEGADRRFWILACRWFSGWRTSLLIVKPETVLRWHRQGWRTYWRRRSRCTGRPGRRPIAPELRTLIRRMTMENRLWGQQDPGGACAAWVQSFSQNGRQVYATNASSRAVHHLAVIPEAERVADLGVRLLLCPNDHVQSALRVFRDPSRQPASCPRSHDAASDRLVDSPTDC